MQLSQFNADVHKNLSQAKVNPITDPNAFGGNTMGLEAMNKTLGIVIDQEQKRWMKDQNDRVIDATNDYQRKINSLLYDEKEGLTNVMQGKNAEGLQEAYRQNEEKIRNEIMKQYGVTSDYAREAFHKEVETSVTSHLGTIDKYQRQELLKYASNQMTEMNENSINTIIRNPDSFGSVYENMETTSRAIMSGTGMDEKAIDIKQREILDHTAQTVLASLAASNDYERGNKLIRQLREKGGNEAVLKKYETLFTGKRIAKTTKENAGTWLDKNPEMMGKTKEEAWEAYRKENPLQLPAQSNETALGRIGDKIAKELGWDPSWGFAIAAHESGRGESAPGNNYFGYKWDGEGEWQELNTWERDENGKAYSTTAKFKKYATLEDSAISYVNWIKTNCTPEEIKGVKSAADVVHIMKKHGYFTDHEESYAASATELAKEYTAPAPMSDEEKAALEDTERNSFLSVFGERVQAKKAKEAQMINDMQVQLMNMEENGKSVEDIYEFIKERGIENPELLESGAYRSMRLSAMHTMNQQKSNGGFGKAEAQNKAFAGIKASIGTDIMSKEDLDRTLKELETRGYGFSPAQIIELTQELQKAKAGEGPYSVKIHDTETEVMEMTGMEKPDIQKYYGEAKKIVMQEAFAFKNKNGREPNSFERKGMWIKAYTQQKIGPNYGFFGMSSNETSPAELMKLGIKSVAYTYDDTGIDAEDYYGRHHYIPAEDWEKVKNQEVNIEDY